MWRLALVSGLLVAAYGGLVWRMIDLHVLQHEKYRAIAEQQTRRTFLKEPRRGDLLDAHGNPFATCIPIKRVFADPSLIGGHYPLVAQALAPLLNYPESDLARLLKPAILRTNKNGTLITNAYVNLKRKVTFEHWQQITQAMAGLSFGLEEKRLPRSTRMGLQNLRRHAVYSADGYQRVYPSKDLAAHVVGYVNEQAQLFNKFGVFELNGADGLERVMDAPLTGTRGWRVTRTDNRRREVVTARVEEVPSRAGLNVVLTLDLFLQDLLEQALAEAQTNFNAVSAQGLILRPSTGEILALASLPDFDPNQPGASPMDHLRNRLVSDMVEPGSTFKIVVIGGALNEQVVRLEDTFDCENGQWHHLGKILRDHDGGYSVLSVLDIVAKSSNIGAAKIALFKLGEPRMFEYIQAFGFGQRTGIPLLGEVRGWIRPPDEHDRLATSRIPMGQAMTCSHLQMALAMAALANGGRLMRPMLVKRVEDQHGVVHAAYEPQPVRHVLGPSALSAMLIALKKVATKDGTAEKAALDHYTVAGKTGTAQKVIRGEYARGKYLSSFIGFFPADAPEVLISVVLDEPERKKGYYGGQVAAPVFKTIAEQVASYLKIRPDREPPPVEVLASSSSPAHAQPAGSEAR
jgi:cell division protein FtsI/penicillin-binding protein 2